MAKGSDLLSGCHVLVTRPEQLAEPLCHDLLAMGATVTQLPTLEIGLPDDATLCDEQVSQLATFDDAIFVSPSAVHMGASFIHHHMERWPERVRLIAIGKGTQRAMAERGWPQALCPADFNSEGVLALYTAMPIAQRRIAIFCAPGGRTLLRDSLAAKGAKVMEIYCYQRQCPERDPRPILQAWQRQQPDVIISTSGQSLQNLWTMLGDGGQAYLQEAALLVISDTMVSQAKALGYNKLPILAENASIEAMTQALINWYQRTQDE